MTQKNSKRLITLIIIFLLVLIGNPFYVVKEGAQAVITQFGEPIGEPVTEPGLHLKLPFVQVVNLFEKRVLMWDGDPNQIPTQDQRYIEIDTTARWRIDDPLKFFESVYNESGAQARLDDIIDGTVRDVIASHNLVEIVRTSNKIIEDFDKIKEEVGEEGEILIERGELERVTKGRDKLGEIIIATAKETTPQYGIELLDVRIKRLNYREEVRKTVYQRMIAERKRAAEEYRSEGRGAKAEIIGRTGRELREIRSQAYREAQEIQGKADAEAARIYAAAYNKDPDFYAFLQTLATYKETIDENTTLIITTDGEYFKYLNASSP